MYLKGKEQYAVAARMWGHRVRTKKLYRFYVYIAKGARKTYFDYFLAAGITSKPDKVALLDHSTEACWCNSDRKEHCSGMIGWEGR